ncbi:YcdB/YcdC domain-containing protein [Lysinibacillus xylanilyticus]|uniref:YcdB/YcdC domain-containing protein n=1 Tax=Lysinibacillus xylanilyticus TaxID=582475 RepID=UPI003D073BE6
MQIKIRSTKIINLTSCTINNDYDYIKKIYTLVIMGIELDCTGNLIYLSIEKNDSVSEADSLSIDEKRRCAEHFLHNHYHSALEDLTFSKAKELSTFILLFICP